MLAMVVNANAGLPVKHGALDLGPIDADGYIWLTGHNIDPQMIEEALHRHPAVALVAAVGKTFKPALRLDAVRRVFEHEVGQIAASSDVQALSDECH